jgi:O-acetyl-ADP-ribose deacetylase (regulator of RNase III)
MDRIGGRPVTRMSLLFRSLTEGARFRQAYSRFIQNNIELAIADGDMTRVEGKNAAWVVPQFRNAVSYGGVGSAVMRAGGMRGLEALEPLIKKGMQYGDAVVTEAGNAKVGHLIHVISVGSEQEAEFDVVKLSVKNALEAADKAGIETVVFPALGTGIIGQLTPTQSAHAMLSAIREYKGESVKQIMAVVYRNEAVYQEFIRVYNCPTEVVSKIGAKEIDVRAWMVGMTLDAHAKEAIDMTPGVAAELGAEEIKRILEPFQLPEKLDAFADVMAQRSADEIKRFRETLSPQAIATTLKEKYVELEPTMLDTMISSAVNISQQYLACLSS